MKIIKQGIQFKESLKQRIEFICEFTKVNPTFVKGSVRKIEKTNLSYVEPHKVMVKNILVNKIYKNSCILFLFIVE